MKPIEISSSPEDIKAPTSFWRAPVNGAQSTARLYVHMSVCLSGSYLVGEVVG